MNTINETITDETMQQELLNQFKEQQKALKEQNELNIMMQSYNNRKVSSGTIWITFLLLGWSYGSMNSMGKQIFYYLTLGGLGVWTLYRLFTLNSSVKRYNRKQAMNAGITDNAQLLRMGLGR